MQSDSINRRLNRSALYIALLVAWVAMLGSLYFSEVLGYIPCELCWIQRILMYPLTALLAIGLLRRDPHLPYLVLPLSLIGMGYSTYHYLLEKTDIFGTTTVCRSGIPCTVAWINWFGFVTIPFLALIAFFLITVFTLVALTAGEPDPEEEMPRAWLPVASIVVAVILVFGGMRLLHDAATPAAELAGMTQFPAPTAIATLSGASIVQSSEALPSQTDQGKQLYLEACAACHGPDASGVANLGNSLVESDVILGMSAAEALAFIRQGVDLTDPRNTSNLVMPPSGGRPDLSDENMLAIIAYLRSIAAPSDTVGAAAGN